MASVEQNLERLSTAGYRLIDHFTLPENDWWENYYRPMIERIESLRQQYAHSPEAQAVLDLEFAEIDLYRQFSDWYGYVFYVAQAGEQ
jgi:hypothetical protein